jgi:hypothetical protein
MCGYPIEEPFTVCGNCEQEMAEQEQAREAAEAAYDGSQPAVTDLF